MTTNNPVNPMFGWNIMTEFFHVFVERTEKLISNFQQKIKETNLKKLEISARQEFARITAGNLSFC
jgi:hypothetical protein